MIVVTGATGELGRRVVDRLLDRVTPDQLVLSVRDPAAVAARSAAGVGVRRGDYTDPAGLRETFAGADRVLLVSSNSRAGDTLEQHGAAIDAARDAGVRRIYYTAHQAASPTSRFGPAVSHAATEDLLAASGVAWTSLRNGFYANTPLYFLGDAAGTGRLVTPEDGPVSWTDRADLAAAAAALLVADAPPDGPTAPLTGPEAVSFDGVARALSGVLGRPVEHHTVGDDEWVARSGMPEPYARMMLGLFAAARAGEFDVVDPTLADLIGHRPRTVADAVTEGLAEGPAGSAGR